MEAVVGKIVAFVVAEEELWPDRGEEFDSFQAVMNSRRRGFYFKKLQLEPTGQILWALGVSGSQKVGAQMYGVRCSCGAMTWSHCMPVGEVLCEDCSSRDYPSDDDSYDGDQEREY